MTKEQEASYFRGLQQVYAGWGAALPERRSNVTIETPKQAFDRLRKIAQTAPVKSFPTEGDPPEPTVEWELVLYSGINYEADQDRVVLRFNDAQDGFAAVQSVIDRYADMYGLIYDVDWTRNHYAPGQPRYRYWFVDSSGRFLRMEWITIYVAGQV